MRSDINLGNWMTQFRQCIEGAFEGRLRFLGLQGSRARGEATAASDYDVVVLLDRVSMEDLDAYRAAVARIPQRPLLCGFVAGVEELQHWSKVDLFQFRYDTVAYYGQLEDYLPPLTREDVRQSLHLGVCNCYHMGSHNFLHERSPELLRACYKGAVFVLQAKVFLEIGRYVPTKAELETVLTGQDQEVLQTAQAPDWGEESLMARTRLLLDWASALIRAEETD